MQNVFHKIAFGSWIVLGFAAFGLADLVPLLVFAMFVMGIWAVLSFISQRNSRAHERLARLLRPLRRELHPRAADAAKQGSRA